MVVLNRYNNTSEVFKNFYFTLFAINLNTHVHIYETMHTIIYSHTVTLIFTKLVPSVLVNKFKQLVTMCNILTTEIISGETIANGLLKQKHLKLSCYCGFKNITYI